MSFTDYTYYVRDINVPVNNPSESDASYVALNNSINRYENDVLVLLLGYPLFKEMLEAYAASLLDPEAEGYAELPEKWNDFINGREFTFDVDGRTITEKWNGLKNTIKVSLLSYYVYYNHRMYGQTHYSGLGEIKAKGENSVIADGSYKLILAWNNMVNLYGEIPFPMVKFKNFFADVNNYVHYNNAASAYNFLLANKAIYTNWVFTPLRKKHNCF